MLRQRFAGVRRVWLVTIRGIQQPAAWREPGSRAAELFSARYWVKPAVEAGHSLSGGQDHLRSARNRVRCSITSRASSSIP